MGSSTFKYLIYCSTVIFIFSGNLESCLGQAQRVQYMQFFNTSQTCMGIAMANLTAATTTIRFDNVTSIRVNGMWGVIAIVNGTLDYKKTVYINNDGGCIRILTSNITSAERYGSLDSASAQIHLFLSPAFEAEPWVADPLHNLDPQQFMAVRSWAFSGNHSWTLYEGTKHTGKRICLQPTSQVRARGYGFTDNADSLISVRSIRYGCYGNGGGGLGASGLTLLSVAFIAIFANVKRG